MLLYLERLGGERLLGEDRRLDLLRKRLDLLGDRRRLLVLRRLGLSGLAALFLLLHYVQHHDMRLHHCLLHVKLWVAIALQPTLRHVFRVACITAHLTADI